MLFILLTQLAAISSQPQPQPLLVCPLQCPFSSIQEAVLAATDRDTIIVKDGVYQEGTIVIDKSISLLGDSSPTIDGKFRGDVIKIKAPHVHISGFTIQNSGASFVEEFAGIKVEASASDCTIANNHLLNNTYGIYLQKNKGCQVKSNQIVGTLKSETLSGNGIHVWSGKEITIDGNHISKHRDGIYFEFVNDSNISNNTSQFNTRYGLHFMQSNKNTYLNNYFSDNESGVAVMYSHKIKMLNNVFAKNSGASSYGLLLKDISDSQIDGNLFSRNTSAAYLEGSNRISWFHNSFQLNGTAIRIFGNCDDNRFTENNFIGNTFEVVTNSMSNSSVYANNYWSQYDGYDLNQDNFGDVPHFPVAASAALMGYVDSAYILVKSPLFTLIDLAEKAFPELTPKTLADKSPQMHPLAFSVADGGAFRD